MRQQAKLRACNHMFSISSLQRHFHGYFHYCTQNLLFFLRIITISAPSEATFQEFILYPFLDIACILQINGEFMEQRDGYGLDGHPPFVTDLQQAL